ncbi:MAG: M14 family zinc carboxypeptidase [candidate division WOR-3 bacterium]
MNRSVMLVFVLAFLLAGSLLGADYAGPKEMKVKVFCQPRELKEFARNILEFYDVTQDWTICAVTEPVYQQLTSRFKVEVLVPDMHEWAEKMTEGPNFGRYHTYQEILDTFAIIANNNPNICLLDTIGTSPTGKYIIALKITQNPREENHRPRMEWDGTTHGNENIGTEVCLYFATQLVGLYGSDPLITYLVNTREIWLIPIVNPEGLISRTRTNSNGIDLNRDYGYAWNQESGANVPWSQPEIQGFRNFMQQRPFVITMTYHSGTRAVMWPWSYTDLATKDSLAHAQLCQRYSSFTGYPAYQIARGLYQCYGTSSDFTHGAEGALGLAAEIASGQPPPQNEIDTICRANWTASRDIMLRGAYGIRGQIIDSVTGAPVRNALVVPLPPDWMTYTDTCGWFFKYCLPGTYSIKVMADGYVTKTITGITVPADTWVVQNIALTPDTTAPITGYKVTTWWCRSYTQAGSSMGFWALGRHDSRTLSLTTQGMVTIEMSSEIINGPGTDFTVYSTTSKPCSVLVSDGWNGPWYPCGSGTGNIACDLTNAGVSVARFIRLLDKGQNYDLDAIEATVVNAPALVFQTKTVIDSPPGGNGDGKLDPGEMADLVLALRNAGRVGVSNVTGTLRTQDQFVSVMDSTGAFGNIQPDSVRTNALDRFRITAAANTPREHRAEMKLYLSGTDYLDSLSFTIMVGELRVIDPIPDGPRTPALYWAYDDVDTGYAEHPTYQWVEIRGQGTRLTLSDDQTRVVDLPSGFGPWRYYGQSFSQISICGNGWVSPGSTTNSDWTNTQLPDNSQPANLALFWDDLYPPSGGGVWYYHDAANHRFIVEFDSVCYYSPRSQWDKAEVIIYDTTVATPSGDNVILMQFYSANNYASTTTGIEDPSCTIGINCLFNGAYNRGCAPLAAGRAIKFTTVSPVGILEPEAGIDAERRLRLGLGCNPVVGRADITYNLPAPGYAYLTVLDRTGRLVRRLVAGELPAGLHRTVWDGRDEKGQKVASGIYWVQLKTGAGAVECKAVLVR